MDAVDRQVLDEHLAGEQTNLQRADVHRALDVLRAFDFGFGSDGGPEIDRQRRHDRGRDERDDHREEEADVPKNRVLAEPLDEFH